MHRNHRKFKSYGAFKDTSVLHISVSSVESSKMEMQIKNGSLRLVAIMFEAKVNPVHPKMLWSLETLKNL